jgi:hypothetical protein
MAVRSPQHAKNNSNDDEENIEAVPMILSFSQQDGSKGDSSVF